MEFVTVWELLQSIGSQLDASEAERVATFGLKDQVAAPRDPDSPGPFVGKTLGETRDEVVLGLGGAFVRAYKLSRAAAMLEHALHHAEEPRPKVFDLRQTRLPRLNPSALPELQEVLIKASQFEERLVAALEAGKLRNFPRHGRGSRNGVGFSVDDWKSRPTDADAVQKIVFLADEIRPLLREVLVPFGPLREAFTGEPIGAYDRPGNSSPLAFNHAPAKQPALNASPSSENLKSKWDDMGTLVFRTLRQAVENGTPVDLPFCRKEVVQMLTDMADRGANPDLDFGEKGVLRFRGKPQSEAAIKARVTRMWPGVEALLRDDAGAAITLRDGARRR